MDRRRQWARVLSAAAGGEDGREALPAAMRLGLDIAPAVVGASVTELHEAGGRTPVWVNELALDLDRAQYEGDSGPCLDAARTREPLHLDLALARDRYPLFTAAAGRYGVRSSLSLPLTGGPRPAALNLYASDEAAFVPDRARAVAELLARTVAALSRPDQVAQDAVPARVLARREEVRRAQGVLGGAPRDALDELVRRSRTESCSIHEVARRVVAGDGPA